MHINATVIADPHEIANVLGTSGIDYMLSESKKLFSNIYFMVPSCVPATNIVAVDNGRVLSSLPLPIAGLMSDMPLGEVSKKMDDLNKAAQSLGSKLSDPFMALSFLALPVIPRLKITDLGLFDVEKFCHVPVYG